MRHKNLKHLIILSKQKGNIDINPTHKLPPFAGSSTLNSNLEAASGFVNHSSFDIGSTSQSSFHLTESNQPYLTIIQDPYPPLNSSPEFFDDQIPSIIDCIQMEELTSLRDQNDDDDVKKEDIFIGNN